MYGGGIDADRLRMLVETIEQLDWVVAFKAYLRAHQQPRDSGCEAALDPADVGGEYATPMPPKMRDAAGRQPQAKPYGGDTSTGKPWPWANPPQSTNYSASAGPRPKTGPLAERYKLEQSVAELENKPGPLDHGERRRILAMAGVKDAEYRDQRAYQAHRARRYCENNPGVSYETAMYRLGIEPPADLVPTS